ncbi:hypothetical protein B0H19DRAFT_1249003 [Mycena capillaripes]|nr:hypothetical protein B0H19DRAFT_1249003 [Mycena capillaripes]
MSVGPKNEVLTDEKDKETLMTYSEFLNKTTWIAVIAILGSMFLLIRSHRNTSQAGTQVLLALTLSFSAFTAWIVMLTNKRSPELSSFVSSCAHAAFHPRGCAPFLILEILPVLGSVVYNFFI